MRRRRPLNGGSAADYFDRCDFAGPQSLLPPSYNLTVMFGQNGSPMPPPYHDDKTRVEAPPAYEMISLTSLRGTEAFPSENTRLSEESS